MLRRLFGGGTGRPSEPELPPAEAIDRALRRLEGDRDGFEIFTADLVQNYYVQVTRANPSGLLGEAVGNDVLTGSARLDEIALQTLTDLGWTLTAVTGAADRIVAFLSNTKGGAGNHTRTWADWTGDHRAVVVQDILSTLVRVYGMAPSGPMEVSDNT